MIYDLWTLPLGGIWASNQIFLQEQKLISYTLRMDHIMQRMYSYPNEKHVAYWVGNPIRPNELDKD